MERWTTERRWHHGMPYICLTTGRGGRERGIKFLVLVITIQIIYHVNACHLVETLTILKSLESGQIPVLALKTFPNYPNIFVCAV